MDVKTNTASNYENLWVCSAHWCISYCLRYKLWFTERLKTIGNFTGIFKRRMKRIYSSYKLIELPQFLDALRRSANTIRMTDSGWSEEISCRMLQLPTIKIIAQLFLYLCIGKLLSNFQLPYGTTSYHKTYCAIFSIFVYTQIAFKLSSVFQAGNYCY